VWQQYSDIFHILNFYRRLRLVFTFPVKKNQIIFSIPAEHHFFNPSRAGIKTIDHIELDKTLLIRIFKNKSFGRKCHHHHKKR
jgi:hypothetical protein